MQVSPGEMVPIVIPIFGMLTGIAITGMVVMGPVGRAVGRVLLRIFGADKEASLPAADVAQLRALIEDQADRLEAQQRQIGELAERQDFAERMLAQAREKKGLPQGGSA